MVLGCLSCARSAGSSGGWCSQVCAAKSPDGPTFSRCRACAVNSGTPWDCNTCFEVRGLGWMIISLWHVCYYSGDLKGSELPT